MNGIYLHGGGEVVALATEDGGGDRQLLWEVVADEELRKRQGWSREEVDRFTELMYDE